jgi:hypothetical protein
VLGPAAAIVGARAVGIRNADGKLVAAWNVPEDVWPSLARDREPPRLWDDAEIVDLGVPGGSLVVWTSPYAPFFGDEELAALRTLGALTGLALDRVRLFQAERQSRVALERAKKWKADARRTRAADADDADPRFLTTRTTSDRPDEVQPEKSGTPPRTAMVNLVEQLLDLSCPRRDDDIVPERLPSLTGGRSSRPRLPSPPRSSSRSRTRRSRSPIETRSTESSRISSRMRCATDSRR